jgi:uncharacterized membrane protein
LLRFPLASVGRPSAAGSQDNPMSYNPPAGAIGHVIASLFGSDPKHAMDEDIVRLKSLLEEGKASVSGRTITLEELEPASAAA